MALGRNGILLLAALGAASLVAAFVLGSTIDPDCEAQGAYGNYCGLQAPGVWSYPLGAAGLVLLGVAGVLHLRSRAK